MSFVRAGHWTVLPIVAGLSALFLTPDASAEQPTKVNHAATALPTPSSPLVRLNFVDRHRMLNEMMAKALCLFEMRVGRSEHNQQLTAAKYVFESTLEHLVDGSKGLGLTAESRPELIETVRDLKLAWVDNAAAINGWSGARWGRRQFAAKALELNVSLHKKLTSMIAIYRDASPADPSATVPLLMAGRQRMLTQKIGKEFCQIAVGHQVDESIDDLKHSLALFKKVSDQFVAGDKEVGLREQPPGLVIDNITLARTTLSKIEPVLLAATGNQPPSKEDLARVDVALMQLLRHWEQIVATYELLN